jgi:pSer/pThr/pTyr-binding forkhead associated (FHA) protein
MEARNTFIIDREDFMLDPVKIISEGLMIGRLLTCDLLLNHPAVSRTQAGIKLIGDDYFIFNFRPSNPFKLNGRVVIRNEALAAGDLLEIGPFNLDVDRIDDALFIKVTLQFGREAERMDVSSPSLTTGKLPELPSLDDALKKKPAPKPRPAPIAGTKALDIFWDKRIRDAGKITHASPLFPTGSKRTGKSQYNWTPTTDLVRHWPLSFFIWGVVIVGTLAGAGALLYANAFAPAPLSGAHARANFSHFPNIANRPNANSCTSCHTLKTSMEENCASCHQAEAFSATIIKPHRDAGIGCISCHAEHRGEDFRPAQAALQTCSQCHSDANRKLFNGHGVSTPHGGTFGYPVVDGKWKWKGLDEEEWSLKKINLARAPNETDEAWRSKQFHSLHLYRVRAVGGLSANADGEMSCSSCHKSFDPIDRDTPRQTCAQCHNGKAGDVMRQTLDAAGTANCTSCHVQHIKDPQHWNPLLLSASTQR